MGWARIVAMARSVDPIVVGPLLQSDRIDVNHVACREQLSQPFDLELSIVARDGHALDMQQLVGSPAYLRLLLRDEERESDRERLIGGAIVEVSEGLDETTGWRAYRLRVGPRAQRLTLVKMQQVFLDATFPEIIAGKLALSGVPHELRLRRDYPQHEYVVQYDETDLAFVSRLAEKAGISFYFVVNDDGGDTMVLCDDNSGFHALGAIRWSGPKENDITALSSAVSAVPSLYISSDYNHRAPQLDLAARVDNPRGMGGAVIDYGDHFKTVDDAQRATQHRCEEYECRRVVFTGESRRPEMHAGAVFELDEHPFMGDTKLLITELDHTIERSDDGGFHYRNAFRAIPYETTYRPPRRTPRPKIAGVLSAIVEPAPGSDGTIPWIDTSGHYRVRLLFDFADHGEHVSRPVRMAQAHAGPGFGTHFPLRPGVEVLLAFVDGDVDRPIIIGAAPNKVTPSPVVDRDAMQHRIMTASGVLIEIEDAY